MFGLMVAMVLMRSSAVDSLAVEHALRCRPKAESPCSFKADVLGVVEDQHPNVKVIHLEEADGRSAVVLRFDERPSDGVLFRYALTPQGDVKSRECLWRPPKPGVRIDDLSVSPDRVVRGLLLYSDRCGKTSEDGGVVVYVYGVRAGRVVGLPSESLNCFDCAKHPADFRWTEVPLPLEAAAIETVRGAASFVDENGALLPLTKGASVKEGSRLLLEEDSQVVLRLGSVRVQYEAGNHRSGVQFIDGAKYKQAWQMASRQESRGMAIWAPPFLWRDARLFRMDLSRPTLVCVAEFVEKSPLESTFGAVSDGERAVLPGLGFLYLYSCLRDR